MRISLTTPVSHLFGNQHAATLIAQASDALELRPENLSLIPSGDLAPITHAHISDFQFDLNLPWGQAVLSKLDSIFETSPETLRLVTFHVSRDVKEAVVDSKGRFKSIGASMSRGEMLMNCVDNLRWVRSRFPDLAIAVENNNFYDTGAYDLATNPTFLREICETGEIGLLFDVAHARVSAGNLGIAVQEYVDALPLERIVQIHVSRPGVREGDEWFDAHECPNLDDVMNAIELSHLDDRDVLPVTIEYYGRAERLVECLMEIRDGSTRC